MRKGDTVFYVGFGGIGHVVKATVLVAHKDGGAKVEAQFFYEEGGAVGPYLGGTSDLAKSEVHPNAMEAENYRAVARALAREVA